MSLLDNASLLLTPNAVKASKLYSVIPSNGNGDFTATRATTATRINSSGLVENVGLNVPRVDYSLGGCPNILLEPQRTNLFLRSEEFDNAAWTKANATILADSAISPSNLLNADKMTGSTINPFVVRILTTTSATNYAISFYVKEDTQRYVYIRFITAADNYVIAVYDLRDGVVGQTATGLVSGTILSATITPAANGFYRIMLVGSVVGTTANIGLSFANSLTGNIFSSLGTTSASVGISVFLWGAQLEQGAYATSYIPTTTASVTRNADSITRNNIFTNGLITAAGGTWFVELRNNVPYVRDAGSAGLILGSNPTSVGVSGFALTFGATPSAGRVLFRKYVASVESVIFTTTTDTVKLAVKWNGSTADVFANGVKVVSATAFTATNMEYIYSTAASTPQFINEMILYPTPLTDAQCLALTA